MRPRRYIFTEREREQLRQVYCAATKVEFVQGLRRLASARPRWPRSVWTDEARRLGLVWVRRRAWSRAEDRQLLEMAGHVPLAAAARALERSRGSVENRARALQMSLRVREGFSAPELARCFGVTERVARGWMAEGLMGRAVDGSDGGRVTESGVRRFIRRNTEEYDLRRVDQLWFLSLAFGEGER